jgi:hypothetical protein
MPAHPVLVVAWLVLAHLVADFVFQTRAMVADKASAPTQRRWRGLLAHGGVVAACLTPVPLAFGVAGLWFVVTVAVVHVVIDRWKVRATRRAEAEALARAHRRRPDGPDGPDAGLGPGWTPIPAALFVLDQLLHVLAIAVAWAVFLAATPPSAPFSDLVDRVAAGWDRSSFHAAVLAAVVGVALVIVNIRAGAFFVATLVRPRESVEGLAMPSDPGAPLERPRAWRVRVGPIEAVAEPDPSPGDTPPRASRAGGSPARIGATIGVLERLLIVTFVLTGSEAAIGFVVAAKTLARFRQLDDRDFAEYYLLGTLASVAVAVGSGLVAVAALRTLP